MGILFAAVLAVMLAMNALMFSALKGLVSRTGKQLRWNAARMLSAYDALLEKKSGELARLGENEVKTAPYPPHAEARGETRRAAPIPPAARYRGKDFPEAYRLIKERFSFDRRAVLRAITRGGHAAGDGETAGEILAEFPFELRCRLALLRAEDQLSLLREALTGKRAVLLERYAGERRAFDGLHFFDWLEGFAWAKGRAAQVRTGDSGARDALYDAEICEGFQIFYGGRLYDYSIRKRELV